MIKMKKLLLITLVATTFGNVVEAQYSEFSSNSAASAFTLSSDANTLQIAGRVSGFYEYRMLKSGITNLSHNGFAVKDFDLDIFGKTANKFEYEFQVSLVDLVTAAATGNNANGNGNPQNPGFKAAYLQYKGWPVHIKFGYDKVPYSQGSMSDVYGTPMWSHANLFGGDLFSRRDFGVTLNSQLLKNRINLYAGGYSGLGENFFEYGNDASGKLEFIGRAEFSYPGKMKYNIIDDENSPVPQFRIAVNARYTDKTQPAGHSIYTDAPDAPGAYGLRVIDGKRLVYGGDAIIMYRGLSATFEAHMLQLQPTSSTDPLFEATPHSFNNGKVNAGGFVTGLNYNFQKIKSVFSVQYEDFNANDLIKGEQSWLYIAYAYKVSGFNSVLKAEYYIPTQEDGNSNPLKYTGQLRIGYQLVF
jgi:hypothetical protein